MTFRKYTCPTNWGPWYSEEVTTTEYFRDNEKKKQKKPYKKTTKKKHSSPYVGDKTLKQFEKKGEEAISSAIDIWLAVFISFSILLCVLAVLYAMMEYERTSYSARLEWKNPTTKKIEIYKFTTKRPVEIDLSSGSITFPHDKGCLTLPLKTGGYKYFYQRNQKIHYLKRIFGKKDKANKKTKEKKNGK